MNLTDAIRVFSKYYPCLHESYESIGTGYTGRCEDCGQTFTIANAERLRSAGKEFEAAMDCLHSLRGEQEPPPPQTEEVEVKRWECKKCDTAYKKKPGVCGYMDENSISCNGQEFLEFTATDTRAKKRKVLKEWRAPAMVDARKQFAELPCIENRPGWIADTRGEFIYRAEVEE